MWYETHRTRGWCRHNRAGSPNLHFDPHNPSGKHFLGQPRMLANLFSVELWERFSFYGMQALVLYYMYYQTTDGGLGIDEGVAAGIVGAYGGTVLLVLHPGRLDRRPSDRFRTDHARVSGADHDRAPLTVADSSRGRLGHRAGVYRGRFGGLKTTCVNLVGTLYSRQDPRRDAGFSIYYMGCEHRWPVRSTPDQLRGGAWGFHWGFALAAIGMAFGLTQYVLTRKGLPETVHTVANPLPHSQYAKWVGIALGGIALIIVLFLTGVLNPTNLADAVVLVTVLATIALFTMMLRDKELSPDEHSRIIAFVPMFIATAAFFALFQQQQFTVIAIYADTRLDLNFFGWQIPPSLVVSINPFFIFVFSLVFAGVWTKLGNRAPATPTKFGIALLLIGAAFLLFLTQVNSDPVFIGWIVLILFVATMG
ncbi:peptide MFS transporter [Kocuria carniphila]|uniref:peptide MFS transporter n=1 Tax=Kocuria carniphila TaxID=262208 RepID=UPI00361985B8